VRSQSSTVMLGGALSSLDDFPFNRNRNAAIASQLPRINLGMLEHLPCRLKHIAWRAPSRPASGNAFD
jgi:hypothetical protein